MELKTNKARSNYFIYDNANLSIIQDCSKDSLREQSSHIYSKKLCHLKMTIISKWHYYLLTKPKTK